MMPVKFRAWDKELNKMIYYGYIGFNGSVHDDEIIEGDLINRTNYLIPMQFTALYDRNGKEIFEMDRLRFFKCPATPASEISESIWDATVIFEDGVWTIDILTPKQVENPKNWTQTHDWIKSRSWSTLVGYGEYGNWNVPRQPLTKIDNGFGSNQEAFEKHYKPIAEKIGFGKRFLNAEVIGNKFENPELLEGGQGE